MVNSAPVYRDVKDLSDLLSIFPVSFVFRLPHLSLFENIGKHLGSINLVVIKKQKVIVLMFSSGESGSNQG